MMSRHPQQPPFSEVGSSSIGTQARVVSLAPKQTSLSVPASKAPASAVPASEAPAPGVPVHQAASYSVIDILQDPRVLVSAAAITLVAAGSFAYYKYKQSKNKVVALGEKCGDVGHKVLTPATVVQGSPNLTPAKLV